MDEDEELLGPAPREWPRWQRWRRPLAALAGFAVLAGGVLTVARSGTSRHHPQAQAISVAISPAPLRTSPSAAPQNDSLTVPEAQLPLCPIGRLCETSYTLPDAVIASLEAHLPGAAYLSARTLVARRSPDSTVLVARVIAIRTPELSGSIEIRRPEVGDADTASVQVDPAQVAGQARARTDGYVITVRVVGRSAAVVRLGDLRELAGDQRLLVGPAANRGQSDDQGQR